MIDTTGSLKLRDIAIIDVAKTRIATGMNVITERAIQLTTLTVITGKLCFEMVEPALRHE